MRILQALLLSGAATMAMAQQQPPDEQAVKDAQARIRTEGSVGGVGNVTPEQRESANTGAGPHLQATPGASHRSADESSSDREAARGATGGERGGERVESRDARQPAQRP